LDGRWNRDETEIFKKCWNWTTFIYTHWKKCICDLFEPSTWSINLQTVTQTIIYDAKSSSQQERRKKNMKPFLQRLYVNRSEKEAIYFIEQSCPWQPWEDWFIRICNFRPLFLSKFNQYIQTW